MNKHAIKHEEAVKLARERYEHVGYRVVQNPGRDDLPPFLRDLNYQPDLVAERGDEHLLVEVKVGASGRRDWSALYKRLEDHPEWDFVLIVAERDDAPQVNRLPSAETIRSRFESAPPADPIAGLLFTWALFEAAAQRQLVRAGEEPKPAPAARVISQLIQAGILEQSDFAPLASLAGKRNAVAHGQLDEQVTSADVEKLREFVARLIEPEAAGLE